LAFIDARLADIVAISFLWSILKLALIIRSVSKFLSSSSMRLVLLPSSWILVILERVEVDALSMRLTVFYLSFVNAAVVKDIASFNGCLAHDEASLIIRAFLKEKLALSIEVVTLPFASIVSLRLLRLLVWIRERSLGN
jgi:hypothetical protein